MEETKSPEIAALWQPAGKSGMSNRNCGCTDSRPVAIIIAYDSAPRAPEGGGGTMDHAKIVQAGVKARSESIEDGLGGWIAEHTGPNDQPALAVALLRMAVNQHIGILGERDAMELLHEMFPKPAFDA